MREKGILELLVRSMMMRLYEGVRTWFREDSEFSQWHKIKVRMH